MEKWAEMVNGKQLEMVGLFANTNGSPSHSTCFDGYGEGKERVLGRFHTSLLELDAPSGGPFPISGLLGRKVGPEGPDRPEASWDAPSVACFLRALPSGGAM